MTELYTDDRQLVCRLLGGDESAFVLFFDAYAPRLYRFAVTRVSHDGDAAEDVVQRTLAKAVTKLATYRGEAALFTWLCTFCRHEISAFHVGRRRLAPETALVEESLDVRAALESLAAQAGDGPEEQYRRREVARLVWVTLDALPKPYADALDWKYVQGWSVNEIADTLRVGPKAAESLLTRARQAFRDAFGALHHDMKVWGR